MNPTFAKQRWYLVQCCLAAILTALVHVPVAGAQSDAATSSEAPEAASPFTLAYDATVASKYLFQGLDYSDGRTVLQPNLAAGFRGFTFGAWGNVQPDLDVLNEIDLSLKYTHDIGRWSLSPGYMMLRYPNRDWDPSQELFLDLAWETPLNPTLSVHYDFEAGKGWYNTLGLSREIASPVTFATNLFYQHDYYETSGIPSMEFKISASFETGAFTFTSALSRFTTWSNSDFVDEAAVPSSWLFAVNVAHQVR